ncbi:MAG: TAXI family TRAP transporter solute-binding subunit [Geminicoccaceae bacterium]
MKTRHSLAILALGLGLATTAATTAEAQQVKLMTGPQGGSWYPLGGAIANIAGKSGINVQVLPGAGIANVLAVSQGKADIGFANSISTVDGVNGRPPFEAVTENVCNIGTLYPQYFQIVVNADSGIETVDDAKGQPIAIQPKGNTAEAISAQLFEVHGMTYDDMSQVSFVSYTDAVSLMKDNNAQMFTLGTTVPASAVMDLASARDIRLLEISDDKFAAMRELNPGYSKLTIPAGSYPGQDADVDVIGYATHVIARCDLDPDVVYNILDGMVADKADLVSIVKVMDGTTLEVMAADTGVPMHEGATRFYQEKGAL